MRGISAEELIEVRKSLAYERLDTDVIDALITLKVKELQEPWMTLEEFLKSGFEGECWIYMTNGFCGVRKYREGKFSFKYGYIVKEHITHVIPIHKPEPPK